MMIIIMIIIIWTLQSTLVKMDNKNNSYKIGKKKDQNYDDDD